MILTLVFITRVQFKCIHYTKITSAEVSVESAITNMADGSSSSSTQKVSMKKRAPPAAWSSFYRFCVLVISNSDIFEDKELNLDDDKQ